jgi:hypothetical protein
MTRSFLLLFTLLLCISPNHSFVIQRTHAQQQQQQQHRTSRRFLFGKTTDAEAHAVYPKITKSEGLTQYIQEWGKLMEGKRLTTPATVQTNEDGVRILFKQVGNTGYKDKDQARSNNNNKNDDSKQEKKKKAVKQGGIQVLVETLDDDTVQVRARRCEMDDETVIKEMSEETILSELKTAMSTWKKGQ